MTLPKNIIKYLEAIYFNPEHVASYSGFEKLNSFIKEDNKHNISKNQLKSWLNDQEVYSTNKIYRRNFIRNRVQVSGLDDIWEIDLIDFSRLSSYNKGVKYILICIDVFSRFVWARGIKSKYADEIADKLMDIFNSTERLPNAIRSDGGRELNNSTIRDKVFEPKDINYYTTNNETQAAYAERVIQTLKSKIWRYMREKNAFTYFNVLQDFIVSYNNTKHSALGIPPIQVTKDNERRSRIDQYLLYAKRNRKTMKAEGIPQKFALKLGESVRIPHARKKFDRFYDEKWSAEVFTVYRRFRRDNICIYKLEDKEGEKLKGSFYNRELQKVTYNPNGVYKIEKVIRTKVEKRKKQVLVKWRGWPKKFNSWVYASNLKDYK